MSRLLLHAVTFSCIFIIEVVRGADDFCIEKANSGGAVGQIYKLEETCVSCGCDGNMMMFCIPDHECRRKKASGNQQPCYRDGVLHSYGSQVQVDCNVCTCENTEWTCTTQDCNLEKLRAQAQAEVCEDKHRKCEAWAKKAARCQTNRFMKKNCHLSCKVCIPEENVIEGPETDSDEHDQQLIEEWKKKLQEQGLIREHENQTIGCQFDCGGKVYPWGSSLQTRDCGLCECKKRGRADYFFQCSSPCPTCNNSD